MIRVRKGGETFPFSRGILARSIATTGLPLDTIYDMVTDIRERLREEGVSEIDSSDLRARVCAELSSRGYESYERNYIVSRRVADLGKPVIILIGGATGVGKSVISAELAGRLGIERIIGTDVIREIMRYMIPRDLIPVLHASSFQTERAVHEPFVEDPLIYGFGTQATLVCEGTRAFIQRSKKEGLSAVINGIHLVPGLLRQEVDDGNAHLFHYMLGLRDEEEHRQRLRLRSQNSRRDSERYLNEMEDIRRIQEYMLHMSTEQRVKWIENDEMTATIQAIVEDITQALEEEARA